MHTHFIWTFRLIHMIAYSMIDFVLWKHQSPDLKLSYKSIASLIVQSRTSHTHEFEARFECLYCFHGCHITEHVLFSTYANFHLFAFLLKLFSVEKCINKPFKNKVRSVGEKASTEWGTCFIVDPQSLTRDILAHFVANAFNGQELVSFCYVV